MTDRIPCKTPGCSNTVLPSTAQRTEGFCMPCVQAAARREYDAYVMRNRHDVNEFDGIEDPVEALKIIHRPRKHDPLVNWIPHPTPVARLYAELDEEQQIRLAKYAQSLIEGEGDKAESIVLCLAAFTRAPLENCLTAFVSHGSIWPSLPFHRASPELRDHLIARLEHDGENRNHILLALAWIGDAVVVDLFARWRKTPPVWRNTLHLPPEDYSREAGWELDNDGQQRRLYFQNCWELLAEAPASNGIFQAITDSQDCCPWCGQQLTNLFDFSPAGFGITDSRSDRLQVTTCEACTAFGTVFGRHDEAGPGQWHPLNLRPKYLPDDSGSWPRLPRSPLKVGATRSPFFAADQFLPTTFSQLGGHPTWIQDAEYPCCPECSKTMMFLAQVDHSDIEDCAEGLYYAFICMTCKTTATTYQQT